MNHGPLTKGDHNPRQGVACCLLSLSFAHPPNLSLSLSSTVASNNAMELLSSSSSLCSPHSFFVSKPKVSPSSWFKPPAKVKPSTKIYSSSTSTMRGSSPSPITIIKNNSETQAMPARGEADAMGLLLKERIVFLGSQIDDFVADAIISQLVLLDALDHTKDIRLFINSPGGSLRFLFFFINFPFKISLFIVIRSSLSITLFLLEFHFYTFLYNKWENYNLPTCVLVEI